MGGEALGVYLGCAGKFAVLCEEGHYYMRSKHVLLSRP